MYFLCHKLLSAIRFFERYILVSIFLVMVVLFAFSVLVREMPGNLASTFAWIEEAVRLLNLFLVFFAIGAALERGRHVSISTLRELLPPQIGKWLRGLIDLVGLIFSIQLVVLSVQLTDFVLNTGQLSPTLNLPMAWVYVAPIAGFSLLALRYLLSLVGFINRFDQGEVEGTGDDQSEIELSSTTESNPSNSFGGLQ